MASTWRVTFAVLVVAIGVRVVLSLNGPLSYDDAEQLIENIDRLSQPRSNHQLSRDLSQVSIDALGVNRISLRIPSLILTTFFLVTLPFLFGAATRPEVIATVLLSYLVNESVIWHLHSPRGYVGMLVCCAFLFGLVLQATRQTEFSHPRFRALVFLLAALLGIYSHFFAALFFLLLAGTALVWWGAARFIRGESLSPSQRRFFQALAVMVGLLLPLVFWRSLQQWEVLRFLGRVSVLAKSSTSDPSFGPPDTTPLWVMLFHCFGFLRSWWAWPSGVLLIALVVLTFRRQPGFKILQNFPVLMLFSVLIFLGVVSVAMPTSGFKSRFLFGFSFPLLFALVEMAWEVRGRVLRPLILGGMGLLLIGIPLWEGPAVRDSHAGQFGRIDRDLERFSQIISERQACGACRGKDLACRTFIELHQAQWASPQTCREFLLVVVFDRAFQDHTRDLTVTSILEENRETALVKVSGPRGDRLYRR